MPDTFLTEQGVEPERYEWNEPPRYRFALDRRTFIGVAGAGLLIATTQRGAAQSRGDTETVSVRLHVAEDGGITVLTGKVEFGQGSRTQITQAAAEELRLPPERITLVMADTARVPNDGPTVGSRTTPATVPSVRRAAAAARDILTGLAARQWNVDRNSLRAENGGIVDSGGRTLSYGDLARLNTPAQAFDQSVPSDITVTPVRDWKVLGSPLAKTNGRDIVTGAHRYTSDTVRPNMLYGMVLRPPSYGATLSAIDSSAAEKIAGVKVVRDGDFVGCVAPKSHYARQAIAALEKASRWNTAPHPSSSELFAHLKTTAVMEGSGRQAPRVRARGSTAQGFASATQVLEASYEVAYIQHAPMEPRAAVAEWQDGRLTVWTGTQRPFGVRRELAQAFRLPEERVRVIVPDTGGGFGGKHTGEAAVEAARLAKDAGQPVSLRWTREEEFAWAYFRPAGLIEIRGGVDQEGRVAAWDFKNYNSGSSALQSPYEIEHAREQFIYCDSPLREGSYRALASTANNFARESFMDELAAASNADPLDFRLANLASERLRNVLNAAAERFQWRERRRARRAGNGVGLSCGIEKGSYVAACAEVAVDREKGTIQVVDVCQAFECGAIHNPDNLRAQVEGCIIMTLGATLREEIQFEDGRLLNGVFSRYPVPRMKDVPPIETVLLNRTDLPSVGAGETPMIAVPPAVANAVYHACSVRLRSMPLRGEALRQA